MEGVKKLGISQPNDCNGENSGEKAVLKKPLGQDLQRRRPRTRVNPVFA